MSGAGRVHRPAFLLLLLGMAALWSGCAASIGSSMPDQTGGSGAHHLTSVPFFPDDTDQCGPATLASVLTFWGVATDPVTLKREIYSPRLRGSLPFDLLWAAQAHGLKADSYKGNLDNVRSELELGHPLIAFLNLGLPYFPLGHYVVVTGYDDARQGVYLHSGLERDQFLPYESFWSAWEKTGRWTLRILPPDGPAKGRA